MKEQNNIVIRFHKMQNTEVPQHLEEYLEGLLRHAPSDSTAYFHIFKEEKGYLCKLTVHSHLKTFSYHFKDERAQSAVREVLRNVKAQVAIWRKNRSSLDITGITSITRLNLNSLEEVLEKNSEMKKSA